MYLTASPPLLFTAQDAPQRVLLRVEEASRRARRVHGSQNIALFRRIVPMFVSG